LTPTLFSILRDKSAGGGVLDSGLGGGNLVVEPHLTKGDETGQIEKAHRQEDEGDRDRQHPARKPKPAPGQGGDAGEFGVARERFGEGGRLRAGLASSREVQHGLLRLLQVFSSSSI
jgi:hypothetical protein